MSRPRTTRSRGLGTLREVETSSLLAAVPGTHRAYVAAPSGCRVIVAHEPARLAPAGIWLPPDELLIWHLSISHPHRYPTWDEIADARYALVPEDVTMAMLPPPPGEYVNEHESCFHLWQIEDRRT